MTPVTDSAPRAMLPLAWRYALRELRSGLRGFYVFVACIALGVMAIAGVGSVAGSLNDGLEHQGRILLGGDASFSLIQREATPQERAFLDARGDVSVAATMRAMARAPNGDLALVDLGATWTLAREDVVSSAGYSIYEGHRFKGRVLHTLVRGREVLSEGRPIDSIARAASGVITIVTAARGNISSPATPAE